LFNIPESLDNLGYVITKPMTSSVEESVLVCLAQSGTKNYYIETMKEANNGKVKIKRSTHINFTNKILKNIKLGLRVVK